MGEPEPEEPKLLGILFFFLFFLLGVLFRQIGLMLKLNAAYHVPLFLTGGSFGLYYLYKPTSSVPLLGQTSSIWIYDIYVPIYYFLGAFTLERDSMTFKIIPYILFVCFPVWIITVASVTFTIDHFFEIPFSLKELAIVVMITLMPDIHMANIFITSKFHFANPDLHLFLQCESMVASCICSILYFLFITGNYENKSEFIEFFAKAFFFSCAAIFLGKMATAAVIRMHNDHVNQISVVLTFIYLTFALVTMTETAGDLAVFMLGLVMMNSKPRLTFSTVDMVKRFLEIFRFSAVCSLVITFSIIFTVFTVTKSTWEDFCISVVIHCMTFGCRLVIINGMSFVTGHYFFQTRSEAFTVSVSNMRGVFNMVLILALTKSDLHLPMENDRLFVIASFQIFFSVFFTTTIASFMATIQRRNNFDCEKISMVYHAIKTINEYKESSICLLRRIAFSADADWEMVTASTSIKKKFLRIYEYNGLMSHFKTQQTITNNQIRRNAIKDLLRLQKRFLEEQFKHGTLGGQSAGFFATYVRNCFQHKSLMSAKQIIESMAPSKQAKIIHRDLTQQTNTGKNYMFKSFVIVGLLCLDFYLLVFATLTQLFLYNDVNTYIIDFYQGFGVFIGVLSAISIIYTGRSFCHIFANSLWNWLSWIICISSFGSLLISFIQVTDRDKQWTNGVDKEYFIHYISVIFASLLVLVRALALSCYLDSVQYLLFGFVTRVLDRATFNQCDACQGFLQSTVDTVQRVNERTGNFNLAVGAHELLHQQTLVARQFLGIMNILTPRVLAALKVRLACRLVLLSQQSILHKLDTFGILDVSELDLLSETVQEKLKNLYYIIPAMRQTSDMDIIKGVPWITMAGISHTGVMMKGRMLHKHAGNVILAHGSESDGIILILDGLVRVESQLRIQSYHEENVHFCKLSQSLIEEEELYVLSDFCSRGNIIGEYPFLTGKTAHKTYRCVTSVRLLLISRENMYELMEGPPILGKPMNRIEFKLWVTVAYRFAARLIQKCFTYQLLARRQVYLMLEDAYVIDGLKQPNIDLTNVQKAAVLLLYGAVYCEVDGQFYKGPCILPSNALQLNTVGNAEDPVCSESKRTVLLVLRSYGDMRISKGMTPIRESHVLALGHHTTDDLTVSSGSSDGAPHARRK